MTIEIQVFLSGGSFKKIANEILKTPQNEWGGLSFSLGKKKRA